MIHALLSNIDQTDIIYFVASAGNLKARTRLSGNSQEGIQGNALREPTWPEVCRRDLCCVSYTA